MGPTHFNFSTLKLFTRLFTQRLTPSFDRSKRYKSHNTSGSALDCSPILLSKLLCVHVCVYLPASSCDKSRLSRRSYICHRSISRARKETEQVWKWLYRSAQSCTQAPDQYSISVISSHITIPLRAARCLEGPSQLTETENCLIRESN